MAASSTRIFAAAGHAARQGFRGGLFRTTADDGAWEELENGLPELVETHALAVDPRDGRLLAEREEGPLLRALLPATSQLAAPAAFTSQLVPNRSTHMPKVSPHGAGSKGTRTVPPSVRRSK
mgnify:CR=1 FL=1